MPSAGAVTWEATLCEFVECPVDLDGGGTFQEGEREWLRVWVFSRNGGTKDEAEAGVDQFEVVAVGDCRVGLDGLLSGG